MVEFKATSRSRTRVMKIEVWTSDFDLELHGIIHLTPDTLLLLPVAPPGFPFKRKFVI